MAKKEISRKITESVVTGGYKKWFSKLLSISMEAVIGANGAPVVDANGIAETRAKNPAPVLPLYKVVGYVNSGKPGASEYGEFIKFAGQFRATNLADGVQTDAPQLILPNFLADSLYGAINTPGRTGAIQIALEFGVKYDESAMTKYTFVVHDLMPATEHDPLAMLEAAVNSGTPLLTNAPAPAPAPAPTPEPTQAPAPSPAPSKRK